eukprot:5444491-Prymnesium_polylepis.1
MASNGLTSHHRRGTRGRTCVGALVSPPRHATPPTGAAQVHSNRQVVVGGAGIRRRPGRP